MMGSRLTMEPGRHGAPVQHAFGLQRQVGDAHVKGLPIGAAEGEGDQVIVPGGVGGIDDGGDQSGHGQGQVDAPGKCSKLPAPSRWAASCMALGIMSKEFFIMYTQKGV